MLLILMAMLVLLLGLASTPSHAYTQRSFSRRSFASSSRSSSLYATKKATIGAGCFWAPQEHFGNIDGVIESVSGYCGDMSKSSFAPSYNSICNGRTNYVEAVQITYDDTKISYEDILREFETVNDSSPNSKRQYKGVIFVADEEEEKLAQKFVKPNAAIEPITRFWKAEGYHQNYWPKWKLRLPVFLVLLIGSGNPGEYLPAIAQQAFFYSYLAALLLAVFERKLDNKVE